MDLDLDSDPRHRVDRQAGWGSWRLVQHEVAGSTSELAKSEPAWTVVAAECQTEGRGRYGRKWDSGKGGLWMSAVLPIPEGASQTDLATFPLAAGEGLCRWVRRLRVDGARLRWPNDILVGESKLAGLIVDQLWPQKLVVGFGMNVVNRVEDPAVATPAIRLVECLAGIGLAEERLSELANPASLLPGACAALREVFVEFERHGFAPSRDRLNREWAPGRRVAVLRRAGSRRGIFTGVDSDGNPVLQAEGAEGGEDCSQWVVPAHEVVRLTELPE